MCVCDCFLMSVCKVEFVGLRATQFIVDSVPAFWETAFMLRRDSRSLVVADHTYTASHTTSDILSELARAWGVR